MATELRRGVHGNPLDADSRPISAIAADFCSEIGDDLSAKRGDLPVWRGPAHPSLDDHWSGFEGVAPHSTACQSRQIAAFCVP